TDPNDQHEHLVRTQRSVYRSLIERARGDHSIAVVVQDFTTINTRPNIGASEQDKELGSIRVHTIAAWRRGKWMYYTYYAPGNTAQDWQYVIHDWKQLSSSITNNPSHQLFGVQCIHVFSDGSKAQFKN